MTITTSGLRLPHDFVIGAATAAYQVEGAVDIDGRAPSIWDTFSHTPGKTYRGDDGDIACDHYRRFEADLDLAADVGLTAYRFSLSWSRIMPAGTGAVNQTGIDHYRRVAQACRERGIRPFATLYHWDLPQTLQDAGGWPNRDTAYAFAEYAQASVEGLGDVVTDWITVNEPGVASLLGYASGEHAPGVRDPRAAVRAGHHLLLAHGLAVRAMRAADPAHSIGISLNHWPSIPASQSEADLRAARLVDGYGNRMFFDPVLAGRYPHDMIGHYGAEMFDMVLPGDLEIISEPMDFLGINYYSTNLVAHASVDPEETWPRLGARVLPRTDLPTDDMGWASDPSGFADLLISLPAKYPHCPPIIVSENGAAFDDYVAPEGQVRDLERIAYLDGHLRAVHAARDAGAQITGYFVWTLLDNFEWSWGYSKRFGLIHVDFATQTRTLKESAHWLRDALTGGALQLPPSSAGSLIDRKSPAS